MKPIPENTVIHCPTKELDQQVCKIFDDAGLKWGNGKSYLDPSENEWHKHKDQTCYRPSDGTYCDPEYFKNNGHTILPAEDFIKMNEVQPPAWVFQTDEDLIAFVREWWKYPGLYDPSFLEEKRKPKFSLLCADGTEVNEPEQIVWILTSRGYSPAIAKEVADGKLKAFSTEQAANIYNKKTILEKNGITKEDCLEIFKPN